MNNNPNVKFLKDEPTLTESHVKQMYTAISFSSITANFLTGMYIGENKNKIQGLRDLYKKQS